jgi:hypothetical protein
VSAEAKLKVQLNSKRLAVKRVPKSIKIDPKMSFRSIKFNHCIILRYIPGMEEYQNRNILHFYYKL